MRTVYLMRHAKSDWDASYVGDHERPLSKRGLKAARRMGEFFVQAKECPSLILCSSSLRTRETLERISGVLNWPEIPVIIEEPLYLTTASSVLNRIRNVDDDVSSVMVLGHEPTTSSLVGSLVGGASVRIPTAACARIDLNIGGWKDARTSCGTLVWLVTPKALKSPNV